MKAISLRKYSGLDLKLMGNKLIFGNGLCKVAPETRTLNDMRPVLQNKNFNGEKDLYYMYRGVALKKHIGLFRKIGIRHDITILKPGRVGKEFVKTFGHFHLKARSNLTYPEIYEVIYGRAEYALQKENDFVVVKAKPGDKVLIPPNYGHVTVNVGKTPLVMANLVYSGFTAAYGLFKKKRGAMYYRTKKWEENKNYSKIPRQRYAKPSPFGKKQLYNLFIKSPAKFKFLKQP